MTVRPERAQGLGRGLVRAHPAAHRRRPGRAGDPARARSARTPTSRVAIDEAELGDARREHPRARRAPADPRDRDARWLPARRRRAARSRCRRSPGSSGSRRSSASSTIRSSSSWRSSRTSSARTSTRSRRPTASVGWSTSSASPRSRSRTRVGRARSTVANTLRLLDLAPAVQAAIAERRITEGHGGRSAGCRSSTRTTSSGTVIEQDLSVRQTEELVRRLREPRSRASPTGGRRGAASDPDLERVEEDLRRALGTKVSLARSRKGGRIIIEYYSDEELGRLYERLTGGTA